MTEATRTLLQVLAAMARIALVYAIFIAVLFLVMANWALPYFAVLKPQILLALVFYWTLYRPTLMPPWVIFVAGLLLDAMNPAMPFGTHAVSYLLVSGLLKPRRRMLMGQPFMMIWVAFIAALLLDLTLKIFVITLFSASTVTVSIILLNALVTTLCFPIVLMGLVWVHRLLPATRGMIAT